MGSQIARYPFIALAKDYLRAGLGLGILAFILFTIEAGSALRWLFLAIGAVFAVFLLRTVARQLERIEWNEEWIKQSTPWKSASIAWKDLKDIRLRYWGSRRKKDGMLYLRFSDGASSVSLDEGLSDFSILAARAMRMAKEKRLALDDITEDNLLALERSWGDHEAIANGTRS